MPAECSLLSHRKITALLQHKSDRGCYKHDVLWNIKETIYDYEIRILSPVCINIMISNMLMGPVHANR